MNIEKTQGLIAAPYTPLHEDGTINVDLIPQYLERLHNNGLKGVFICGSTGEGTSLMLTERMQIAEAWTNSTPQGFKVFVHVGSNSVKESALLARHAYDCGAFAIAATGPSYFKPASEQVLVNYMAEIAMAAKEIPFYYYHIPGLNQNYLSVIRFLELAIPKISNLAGIKYTHEDEMEFQLCRQIAGGQLDVLYGRDETLICGLALGARGGVGSTYNFMPELYYSIIKAFDKGDLEEANRLQIISMRVIQVYTKYGGISAGKAIMRMLGLDCGVPRLPVEQLPSDQEKALFNDLKDTGFFEYSLK
ncbi:MAG: dihydrodipicolinate synthetase [Bacteroidetes bacterium]|nr:dihydrodipicolinate synthetase [Bacteroidota bacterium]MBT3749768.1 dihydrodipicolinate synthetase [Bacteroidota bacterium]MBT4398528.1 dihydrodipicolinate synthetase [Bacteroidota bacterium]MBT4410641.1 dihydrodipicolinate synthetase [Bacteroidota bacterium]MBT7092413.1 dihydrodipicolinate synthetase [Bacteroidota bacterium]